MTRGIHASVMRTLVIEIVSFGVPLGEPAASSALSVVSVPAVTCPNSEYFGGNATPCSPVTMNHWLPFVFIPEFAIASEPTLYWPAFGNSSANW